MRALIQRVSQASVTVERDMIARIGPGLLVLVCAMRGDDAACAAQLAAKIARLRIFTDEGGKMNRSVLDTGGAALVVSQFTLAADTARGNRPGFSAAAPPAEGEHLYQVFAAQLSAQGVPVQTGRFGAEMAVDLTNDGPVTIWMEI
ncbi:D-tyrosyl-tRNA(Tyr) deacylase [Cribrihabitans marinus]|uniref:D-aminoacyl-tRNA deacylase n=1 Tax=Cribrihabitans marinus TaxID=1227549 RepID=A0A1H7A138_9RHOB|nr:D-aminoacyl-tRNA deacylase [Cribrihabitans marinus]GGH29598.1 D-aminoacyl-tRNA deacylase [Cribrihabitans marinus]SEJ59409.1 D-tyrosyl-tRNA(Tyr) deacylase [Cribrihabitans marinus]